VEGLARLIAKYKRQGLFVDSNLLLLFCVGAHDPDEIEKFKRTRTYLKTDFELLSRFFAAFDRIITTPNILTEVTGLSNQLNEHLKSSYFKSFAKQIEVIEEIYVPSRTVCAAESFTRYGLTDASIFALGYQYLFLSDDFRLVGYLQRMGIDSINFNHLRYESWH
jgi:hypothetical protein